MIMQDITDEELKAYVWGAAGVHAKTVHGGGVDKHCDACTRLSDAIDGIAVYPKQDGDGRAA